MKFFKFLFSGLFTGILLIVFAVAIGYATFVENDFGAMAAKLMVYNAKWFEVLMLLMIINFSGMIFTKKLYRKSVINVLVIHLSFIVIIIGAALTRYVGFEGQMHIRNGQTTDKFLSSDTYFNVKLKQGTDSLKINKKILLSPAHDNLFDEELEFNNEKIRVTLQKFYPNAVEELTEVDSGDPYLHVVAASGQNNRQELFLKEGERKMISGMSINFGDTLSENNIQVFRTEGKLAMKTPFEVKKEKMTEGDEVETFEPGVIIPLDLMNVYSIHGVSFLFKSFFENAALTYKPTDDETQEGTSMAKVKVNDKELTLLWGKSKETIVNGVNVNLVMGYELLELPFSLKLNEFQLERYPGSDSPSSFASDITLLDEKNNIEQPYRIFMNNILEYKGYRFYQSSYDPDEKGTILSVNHDYWGTLVTYFGYFLLFASLILSFFTPGTKFRNISKQIKEIHHQRKKLLLSGLLILFSLTGLQNIMAQGGEISKEHAASFGKLFVQSHEGRISPVNTLADQLLVKVYKKNTYSGLNAEQVFLDLISNPAEWELKPIIKVYDPALISFLGIDGKYAKFTDFVDEKGRYKLKEQVDRAYIKKPALRSLYEKELLNVNERVNVYYTSLHSGLLKIFPVPEHPNNNWVNPSEFHKMEGHGTPKGDMFENYLQSLKEAKKTGNYEKADAALTVIRDYQKELGKAIIPSETKADFEILYNKINIFKRLFPVYLLLGIILIGMFFIQIFKPSLEFKILTKVLFGILFIAFLTQTLGLALRWYTSGHAPWSNGYESMIYISWAALLAGFIFMKKSPVTLALTALLSGIALFTAHMSWMNPEITNLVPVLKSYWLTIHVATITASYGFLALGSMMGFLNLCIIIFRNNKNHERVDLTLKELTLTMELSFMVGLTLLVIGNFLGGIWANESWGRYWGWDPKETWSLVTIIVYSFILHIGLIPYLKNRVVFNFLAMISFGSVIMTYFGVNYFLSGLHSYAQGDLVVVPDLVYYIIAGLLIIGILAALNEYKMKKQKKFKSIIP